MHELDAGVADQNVDAAVGYIGGVDPGIYSLLDAHVHAHAHRDAARADDVRSRRFGSVLV
jgi:hypothetical protein